MAATKGSKSKCKKCGMLIDNRGMWRHKVACTGKVKRRKSPKNLLGDMVSAAMKTQSSSTAFVGFCPICGFPVAKLRMDGLVREDQAVNFCPNCGFSISRLSVR